MTEVRIRFTYHGGKDGVIRGEWINGLDAYRNHGLFANQSLKVMGIEIEREHNLPRNQT